jgi:hypothetical protein
MNEALSRANDGGACVGKVFVSNPFDVFSRSAVLEAVLGRCRPRDPTHWTLHSGLRWPSTNVTTLVQWCQWSVMELKFRL